MAVAELNKGMKVEAIQPEKKQEPLGTVVITPRPEKVRMILTAPHATRDDVNPTTENGVRVISEGEVLFEGTALFGFSILDKAIAGGKARLERVQ